MEAHPAMLPQSNLNEILPKLSQLPASSKEELKQFIGINGDKTTFDEFRRFFNQACQGFLSEHEIITLARHFGEKKKQEDDIEVLVATVQEELRKVNYESFSVMMDACVYQDEDGTGFIPRKDLWNITKSFNVPIKNHLVELVIENTDKNGSDEINYRQFVNFLNWRDYPVMTQKFKPSLAYGVNIPDRIGPKEGISSIHLKPLMDAIGV